MARAPAPVPAARIRLLNGHPLRPEGRYVLHWMTAFRRTRRNFALQRAAELASELRRPLLVLEALRCDHPWASERFHRFVLDGMAENGRALEGGPVRYHPYVEPAPGAGRGLLEALAAEACAVTTDDWPCFFHPAMAAAAAARVGVRMEAVDGNGLLPLSLGRAFPTAHALRRFLQRELPPHLGEGPAEDPLAGRDLPPLRALPAGIGRRWPAAGPALLAGDLRGVAVDRSVGAVDLRGGAGAARKALRSFVRDRLPRYGRGRNHPDGDAASGLSPWLHFGHLSVHEVLDAVAEAEGWSPDRLGGSTAGSKEGWWGMSPAAESFLDEVVTWRELGHLFSFHRPADYDRFESLPDWARATLEAHAGDPRVETYGLDDLAAARTSDPVWNAAQRQLLREGRMHNYLRMLWGKRILGWSEGPREALAAMVELNNRYALDGRDPNSYSGILWCLGRFDRPWFPERPVFGTVRYMSTASTLRKLRMKGYLARYGDEGDARLSG
ncbi:MAG: deoxyribodipyrimidine photolyase [Planctomycetes bacterium]|nr:deoxyribodipyrimidine photolyase [Planctomycetota bacterium]